MLSRAEYSSPMAVDFFNFFREDQRTPEVGEALAYSDPIDVPRLRNLILDAHLSVKSPAFRSRSVPPTPPPPSHPAHPGPLQHCAQRRELFARAEIGQRGG